MPAVTVGPWHLPATLSWLYDMPKHVIKFQKCLLPLDFFSRGSSRILTRRRKIFAVQRYPVVERRTAFHLTFELWKINITPAIHLTVHFPFLCPAHIDLEHACWFCLSQNKGCSRKGCNECCLCLTWYNVTKLWNAYGWPSCVCFFTPIGAVFWAPRNFCMLCECAFKSIKMWWFLSESILVVLTLLCR